ncbi:MAG: DUF58 domain-containing protein [Gammaproteobacteria bacterium]|nr:DUF58 domain-containing protein [Gammaproteobacteria bacterium]
MVQRPLSHPQTVLKDKGLQGVVRVAGRFLSGRPRTTPGNRPHRRHSGTGLEFMDFRRYQPGDNPRDIDWKTTLRSQYPQIRRYQNDNASDWVICLDRSASMGSPVQAKWSLAVKLASALAYILIQLDHQVALQLFSDRVDNLRPLARGPKACAGLMRLLEASRPQHKGGGSQLLSCAPHIPSGCNLIVISDFLVDGVMTKDLGVLSGIGADIHALQIRSSAEMELQDLGRGSLYDVETGEQVLVDLNPAAVHRAELQLRALTREIESYCDVHRIIFSSWQSSDNWKQVLLGHLRRMVYGSA